MNDNITEINKDSLPSISAAIFSTALGSTLRKRSLALMKKMA